MLRLQGKPAEAIHQYREAVRIDPSLAEAYNNLGVALMQIGKRDEAITCYRRALVLKPDFAKARKNLSTALNE